jgi:hypothetical protein
MTKAATRAEKRPSEMQLRVALAIWGRRREAAKNHWPLPAWEYETEELRLAVLDEAAAAVEAMREPTWHMLLDGQKQVNLSEVAGEFEFLSRDEIERIWSEMIDTALRD